MPNHKDLKENTIGRREGTKAYRVKAMCLQRKCVVCDYAEWRGRDNELKQFLGFLY